MQRLEITTRHEIEVVQHQPYRHAVDVITGEASFVDPHCIKVRQMDGSSREIEALPRVMVVVCAGVICVEYAAIFSALDIEVVLVDERPIMLDFLDPEIVEGFTHHLRERGVLVRLGEKVTAVDGLDGGRVRVMLASGKQVCADLALNAAGRQGNTDGLGLKNAGLSTDARGRLTVNADYQTSVPHIYAAGDVEGFPSLASISMEARPPCSLPCLRGPCTQRFEHFPFGIQTVPEMSVVGLTEQETKAQRIAYEVSVARIRETPRGQISGLRKSGVRTVIPNRAGMLAAS